MRVIKIASLILVLAGFSACLKDKNVTDKKYGVDGIGDLTMAYFPHNSTSGGFYAGNKDTTINILAVQLRARDSVSGENVTVKLRRRDDLVLDNGLDLPPADKFKLGSLDVVIEKGSDRGMLKITGNPQDIIGHNYGLAFEIESVSGSNHAVDVKFDSIITVLELRNKYDGVYIATGTLTDHTSEEFTSEYPLRLELHTTGDNSVTVFDVRTHSYGTPMVSDGSFGTYGFSPEFTFAPDGKVTNMVNVFGQGASARRRWVFPDPSGTNAYNFSNNTLPVKFTMNEGTATNVRCEFNWVLTRVGPRP